MLFTREFKSAIRDGTVTRTYRKWKRPQARIGARYNLAPDGVIEVTAIRRLAAGTIEDADAVAAGFQDATALLGFLKVPPDGEVYRIDLRYLGPGRVRQPDTSRTTRPELDDVAARLARMDARAETPWTAQALATIGRHPGTRAGDLAAEFDWDTPTFKRQIRKLKALGLTHSLETGYELSARGRQVLARMR